MRRIAPWLPIVTALGMATVVTAFSPTTPWAVSVAIWVFVTPYLIPMLLLAAATGIRRRSAAPPWTWQVALALALPALVLAVLPPLFIAAQFVFQLTIVEDYAAASFCVWAASVVITALWLLCAACRWVWWPRPVAAVGTPPYRVAAPPRDVPRASRTRLHGRVAICLVSVGLVAFSYALSDPPDFGPFFGDCGCNGDDQCVMNCSHGVYKPSSVLPKAPGPNTSVAGDLPY
jgi:hypothetical protein